MNNLLNNNSSKTNFYEKSEKIKEFCGCEAAISKNYFITGRFCVDTLIHGYAVIFGKNRAATVLNAMHF